MDAILNWVLRGLFLAIGLGAALWVLRWLVQAWRSAEERWPLRVAIGMLLLALVYTAGHARLLAQREQIEEGRMQYVRFGDPRRTELRRAEVRGSILDCTGKPENALALYRERQGVVERTYPLGQGGANLVGGGPDADERDYTIERLYADQLREPRSLLESGELHPAGTDMQFTLCSDPTATAWEALRRSGHPGTVVAQDVSTGALVAYASTGGPDQPPMGLREYAAPGSVFKLAVAAVWWENQLPDTSLTCQSEIQVSARSTIHNNEGFSIPRVKAPAEMLTFSCNTTAVIMTQMMRERLGEQAFVEAYRRFGFEPYPPGGDAPGGYQRDFWATESNAWRARLSPPPARIRIGERTGRDEWAQLSIGQGPIDVTAIHVSRFVQAIGNGGVMLHPTVETEAAESPEGGTRVMSEATAQKLMTAMLDVVDRGSGRRAQPFMQNLAGWDIGAKTGTAQVANAPDNGWFASLVFDAENRPRYTVVVFLRGGGPGGRAPAVVAAQVARTLARTHSEVEE